MEKTTFETTQAIRDICTQSAYLQREGKLNYFYVYIHTTTKGIPFYVGQGSYNRAYKYTGRSQRWYTYVGDHTPIVSIVKHSLSFQESVDTEKQFISLYKDTLINEEYGHSPNETFAVLCFTRKGVLVRRYKSAGETIIDGFSPACVSMNCNNFTTTRSTHKNYVWCYEKDYENRKDAMFKMGLTVTKPVEVTFPDGTIKEYPSMSATQEDGLSPSKVREVLMGTRKSHRGCSFKFID